MFIINLIHFLGLLAVRILCKTRWALRPPKNLKPPQDFFQNPKTCHNNQKDWELGQRITNCLIAKPTTDKGNKTEDRTKDQDRKPAWVPKPKTDLKNDQDGKP